jgi:hypothetical protein
MLTDFIEDVLKDIDKQTQTLMTSLIAADGNSRHDLIRGRITGLSDAKDAMQKLAREYNAVENVQPVEQVSQRVASFRAHRRGL